MGITVCVGHCLYLSGNHPLYRVRKKWIADILAATSENVTCFCGVKTEPAVSGHLHLQLYWLVYLLMKQYIWRCCLRNCSIVLYRYNVGWAIFCLYYQPYYLQHSVNLEQSFDFPALLTIH